MFESDILMTQQ